MTLQDLGSIGELISAIAVIVSLAYLAIQIRQNTRVARATTLQQWVSMAATVNNAVAQSGEFSRVYRTGCEDPAALDRHALRASNFSRSSGRSWMAE